VGSAHLTSKFGICTKSLFPELQLYLIVDVDEEIKMKLPIQSAGIEITKADTKITETKSLYPAKFPRFHETSFETQLLQKHYQLNNFRVTIGDLDSSDCCLICRPGCHCCYAFSDFVPRT
jgi:hypothetical protein